MSSTAHEFTLERLRKISGSISRKKTGRLLLGFVERRLRVEVERFFNTVYSFEPKEEYDDELYEAIDEGIGKVIDTISQLEEPFYKEAVSKLTDLRTWIAQGYAPSHPPSPDELRERAVKCAMELVRDTR